MNRPLPEHPTLFAKFSTSLIGARDDIVLPSTSPCIDWEGELAIVIGRRTKSVTPEEAADHIAGYTILNDITARDWQYRTSQWLQGKTFDASTPLGPYLVRPEDFDSNAMLYTRVDNEIVQQASVSDLHFSPADIVSYASQFMTLECGDVISTGTPGGVGQAFDPPRYLERGQCVSVSIDGLGETANRAI